MKESAVCEEPASPSAGLNREQWEAVRAAQGPVIVIAGPGTGKTRTLVHRIAHLVGERGVAPHKITAVTFTNKAALEVRQRVSELLGGRAGAEALTVGTFHSLCLDLLRKMRPSSNFSVLDEMDAREILADVLRETGGASREAARVQKALALYKSRGLSPTDAEVPEDLRHVFEAYQERLAAYRALDYDDLLLETVRLLEEGPVGDAQGLRDRFTHLLVDEFQDVNPLQYKLVRLWARDPRNLFVIGDPAQAIYGFRGADHRLFGQLKADFPGARIYRLTVNYRSTPTILRAAQAVVAAPDLRAFREDGPKILCLEVPSELAEGIAVVREIVRLVGGATMLQADGGGGRQRWGFSDIAVLFRTGRQAGVMEECFLKEGLPYRVVGRESFLEERPVREALHFFRYVADPEDHAPLVFCLSSGRFKLGARSLTALREGLRVCGSAWQAVAALASEGNLLDPRERAKLRAFKEAVEVYRELAATEPPEKLLAGWAEQWGYGNSEPVRRLLRVAARSNSLASFLRALVLAQEADWERPGDNPACPEAVTLMTLHAAKGLEFPVVFITGVEEGLIPLKEAEDPAEERRLFYVGLTRARDLLVLTAARARTLYGTRLRTRASAFLEELPPDCLEKRVWTEQARAKKGEEYQQLRLF